MISLARSLDLGADLAALVVAMGDYTELAGRLAVAEEDHAGRFDHAVDGAGNPDILAFEVVAELRDRGARLKPQGDGQRDGGHKPWSHLLSSSPHYRCNNTTGGLPGEVR